MRVKEKVRKLSDPEMRWVNQLRAEIIPCEHCEDGYLPSIYEGVLNTCICKRITMYIAALLRARIPKKYWWHDFEDLGGFDPKVRGATAKFIDNIERAVDNGLCVLYHGRNGTGKTTLMCEIGKVALTRGLRVLYVTAEEYVTSLRDPDVEKIDLSNVDVVLFDELEKVYKAKGSSFADRMIEDAIRKGVNRGQSFVFATNHIDRELTEDERDAGNRCLEESIGESLRSMLLEHARSVEVNNSDFRLEKVAEWDDILEGNTDGSYYDETITKRAHAYGEAIMLENAKHLWGENYHEHKIG